MLEVAILGSLKSLGKTCVHDRVSGPRRGQPQRPRGTASLLLLKSCELMLLGIVCLDTNLALSI